MTNVCTAMNLYTANGIDNGVTATESELRRMTVKRVVNEELAKLRMANAKWKTIHKLRNKNNR